MSCLCVVFPLFTHRRTPRKKVIFLAVIFKSDAHTKTINFSTLKYFAAVSGGQHVSPYINRNDEKNWIQNEIMFWRLCARSWKMISWYHMTYGIGGLLPKKERTMNSVLRETKKETCNPCGVHCLRLLKNANVLFLRFIEFSLCFASFMSCEPWLAEIGFEAFIQRFLFLCNMLFITFRVISAIRTNSNSVYLLRSLDSAIEIVCWRILLLLLLIYFIWISATAIVLSVYYDSMRIVKLN